jgi:L-lactate dehydrogenase (cytochrome)
MPVITNIEDLKAIYKRRTPKMFYDYCESGSWTEQTFRENTSDFADIRLRQRVAVDMSNRSTATQMIGQDVSMPVALAPVGLTGMQSANGEIKAAKAAEKFGVPFTLSTMSICSIEDVAAETSKPFWFQVYMMKDRDFMESLIERAKAANCSALVLTLDLQLLGQRHKDIKNAMTAPPRLTVANILNIMTKPHWAFGMLGAKRRTFGNIQGYAGDGEDMTSLVEWTAGQFDLTLTWEDVKWVRDRWDGPLIIKGILDSEDARRAADAGAQAITVSNHGGRQLDGALSSIRILPDIVEAVGDQIEVHLDSGIRSGQDVLKAIAMGAKGTMIGRAWVYGLGELDTTLGLVGARKLDQLSRENLLIPADFRGRCE